MTIDFNPERFLNVLDDIGLGMLGIFAVTFVIIVVTTLFNNIMSRKK
ncbi:MAG: hypothetical protein PHD46_08130 [Eubacteriales bacterium]|nr:hypothetical protein [Eubacteriales bacterium]MDD4422980.1 hypothetical protein [Eubacteriales bacterium]